MRKKSNMKIIWLKTYLDGTQVSHDTCQFSDRDRTIRSINLHYGSSEIFLYSSIGVTATLSKQVIKTLSGDETISGYMLRIYPAFAGPDQDLGIFLGRSHRSLFVMDAPELDTNVDLRIYHITDETPLTVFLDAKTILDIYTLP